ncbi:MAG: putative photosynthetic complex assembly protein PuhE [Pseudomonadota bacterium]
MTLAILFACFVWWFSTGAILWMVSRGSGRGALLLTAPIAAGAFYALYEFAYQTGDLAAYGGFCAAIVLWGWFELAFLTGVITGPNTLPCPLGLKGMRRFLLAWGTIAHHELTLLLTAIALGSMVAGAPEQTGLWTFLILFFARISAKLNIYLGVSNLSHEMMPGALAHMKTYFADRRMNWLFPVSITLLTFAIACWIERAIAVDGSGTGFILLAALTSLALVEHWLMVLPVRDSALWSWMTKRDAPGQGAKPAD